MDKRVIPPVLSRAIIGAANNTSRGANSPSNHDQKAALEGFPHVIEPLTSMWGYLEARAFLERLLLTGPDRENRKGFPPETHEELMFLYNLAVNYQDLLLREKLSQTQLDELAHQEKLRRTNVTWNAFK